MTLKEKLDAVWADPHVCCPSHLVRWNTIGVGYSWFSHLGLFWTQGTRRISGLGKKKGYSFLPKNYSRYYLHLN